MPCVELPKRSSQAVRPSLDFHDHLISGIPEPWPLRSQPRCPTSQNGTLPKMALPEERDPGSRGPIWSLHGSADSQTGGTTATSMTTAASQLHAVGTTASSDLLGAHPRSPPGALQKVHSPLRRNIRRGAAPGRRMTVADWSAGAQRSVDSFLFGNYRHIPLGNTRIGKVANQEKPGSAATSSHCTDQGQQSPAIAKTNEEQAERLPSQARADPAIKSTLSGTRSATNSRQLAGTWKALPASARSPREPCGHPPCADRA